MEVVGKDVVVPTQGASRPPSAGASSALSLERSLGPLSPSPSTHPALANILCGYSSLVLTKIIPFSGPYSFEDSGKNLRASANSTAYVDNGLLTVPR